MEWNVLRGDKRECINIIKVRGILIVRKIMLELYNYMSKIVVFLNDFIISYYNYLLLLK